jgi:hypothetical protein
MTWRRTMFRMVLEVLTRPSDLSKTALRLVALLNLYIRSRSEINKFQNLGESFSNTAGFFFNAANRYVSGALRAVVNIVVLR